ncbi:MAG: type II toxin-antitoxin system RelE/ParE family toxin [bacterium]
MKYALVYTNSAAKDVKKLDTVQKKKLAKKIVNLRKHPQKISKKLLHPKLGTFRYRIGDFRVIFDLVGGNVVVLRIGHRKEIYR